MDERCHWNIDRIVSPVLTPLLFPLDFRGSCRKGQFKTHTAVFILILSSKWQEMVFSFCFVLFLAFWLRNLENLQSKKVTSHRRFGCPKWSTIGFSYVFINTSFSITYLSFCMAKCNELDLQLLFSLGTKVIQIKEDLWWPLVASWSVFVLRTLIFIRRKYIYNCTFHYTNLDAKLICSTCL